MAANLNVAPKRLQGVGQDVTPNTDRVTVETASEVRRPQHGVGIGYGDDIAEARRETEGDCGRQREGWPAGERGVAGPPTGAGGERLLVSGPASGSCPPSWCWGPRCWPRGR
ncbi:hypothetical protein DAERI_220010 [Deinococcus aerius]|uniref:Uncharacterized protein n=1 Tax=Deinococcus aerius TaxID=200253 RepID=A0A2I9DXU6_9DEIO|nr:hypothetical protein DAERI_220010 [Deinococcus aerius]